MIQPGMMFGGEGPVMQGTWYNPHTGDAFTVRDSFFEDNQYTVTTTDGRYLRYDQIQNYIQSDMKLEDLKKSKPAVTTEAIPSEVSNLIDTDEEMILPEDAELLQPKIGNIYTTSNVSMPQVKHYDIPSVPVNMNTAIIEKALKNTQRPDFVLSLNWTDYPEKQIEMLKDIMDIPVEEIVEWYLDNIQFDEFVRIFKAAINEKIMKDSTINIIESEPVVIDVPEVVDPYTEVVEVVDEPKTTNETKKIGGSKAAKVAKEAKEKKTKTSKK